MLSEYKTEIIGISAEIAIADAYNIPINPSYRKRGNRDVIKATVGIVFSTFDKYNIPRPVEHIAERQNPVDFKLVYGKTLSVKTNQKKLGKVAPQYVGQPTSSSYFAHFKDFYEHVPQSYEEKCKLFKSRTFELIDKFLYIYWDNMFDCDFLIHFYDFLNSNGGLNQMPQYVVLNKQSTPHWERDKFTFTQTATTWNESNTVKYCGITIGEFQIHTNRDCFKFRFNMDGLSRLIEQGII